MLNHSEGEYDDGHNSYRDDIPHSISVPLRWPQRARDTLLASYQARRPLHHEDGPLRRDILFMIGYVCVVFLVLEAVQTTDWQPIVTVVQKTLDRVLQHLGLDF